MNVWISSDLWDTQQMEFWVSFSYIYFIINFTSFRMMIQIHKHILGRQITKILNLRDESLNIFGPKAGKAVKFRYFL